MTTKWAVQSARGCHRRCEGAISTVDKHKPHDSSQPWAMGRLSPPTPRVGGMGALLPLPPPLPVSTPLLPLLPQAHCNGVTQDISLVHVVRRQQECAAGPHRLGARGAHARQVKEGPWGGAACPGQGGPLGSRRAPGAHSTCGSPPDPVPASAPTGLVEHWRPCRWSARLQ